MPSNKLGIYNNNVFIPYTATTKRSKDLNITSYVTGSGFTTTRATAKFEADSNNVWRVTFNIVGTMAYSARTGVTLTVAGVTFKTVTGGQACDAQVNNDAINVTGNCSSGASTIVIAHASNSVDRYYAEGTVELDAEPTWSSLGTTASAALEGVLAANVFIPSASATESGLITTGTQTIAGVKTFSSGIKTTTRLWAGSSTANNMSVTSTSYTNLSTPVTLTFTAPVTGKYKAYANTPLLAPSSAQIWSLISVSAGSTIYYSEGNADNPTAVIMVQPFTLITLTAGVEYTFNVQCKVSSGTGAFRGDRTAGITIVAELIEQT